MVERRHDLERERESLQAPVDCAVYDADCSLEAAPVKQSST